MNLEKHKKLIYRTCMVLHQRIYQKTFINKSMVYNIWSKKDPEKNLSDSIYVLEH